MLHLVEDNAWIRGHWINQNNAGSFVYYDNGYLEEEDLIYGFKIYCIAFIMILKGPSYIILMNFNSLCFVKFWCTILLED